MPNKRIDVLEIDSSVPIPETAKKVPVGRLEVGESILFPLSKRGLVQNAATYQKRKYGRTYTVKKQDVETARIWRVS